MRILFFGMPGRFSAPPLRALLASGAAVLAVAVPAPPGAAPLTRLPPPRAPLVSSLIAGPAPSITQLAGAAGIPVLGLRSLGRQEVAAALAELRPDVACVACWPWRIPPSLLSLPPYGFLNLHPSPLPELRGPEPLFWAFQQGLEQSGVTLHQMDAQLDTGAIIAQAALDLPAGITGPAAEAQAAERGAELLATAIRALQRGEVPDARPQPAGGSFYKKPGAADFQIDRAWAARRAFHFMRGTAHWGVPYRLTMGGEQLLLAAATSYEPEGVLGAAQRRSGGLIEIQMSPGTLTARVGP
jgi:methionyl-tRNA formyltransferase